ncbi:MAG: hypothetical protein ABSB65_02485, partial [Candidatus Acidiferrales bacterium]
MAELDFLFRAIEFSDGSAGRNPGASSLEVYGERFEGKSCASLVGLELAYGLGGRPVAATVALAICPP